MSTRVGLRLEPLDVLFFRDGRPFGAATRARSELPLPQTLAGALWTALLERHGCRPARFARALVQSGSPATALREAGGPQWLASLHVRGPWLARASGGAPHAFDVLVPAPATLHQDKDARGASSDAALPRLRPLASGSLPGWAQSLPADMPALRPLWIRHQNPTEPAVGYLGRAALEKFLADKEIRQEELVPEDELLGWDQRTGIGIDADRLSAEKGLIYGASFLALREHVFLYAEAVLPDEADGAALRELGTLALGGEGRRVVVTQLDRPYDWPGAEPADARRKPLLLLTTPGLFQRRWEPDCLAELVTAAAVPGAVSVSGWDLARGGPKPARFAAQAGSVYFLDRAPEQGLPDSLADKPEDRAQGWGCYVQGVWNDN